MKYKKSILECIGDTPMVRLNGIPKREKVECEIFGKCEYLNPGGSIKDRVAYEMIENAERLNSISPSSSVLVAPTSGNTGISMGLVGKAVKQYPIVVTMKRKNSGEKEDTMKLLGVEIRKTPTDAQPDSKYSHINVASSLGTELKNGVVIDQYSDRTNSLVHFEQTAQEIALQCERNIHAIFIGVGTGGSINGIGKRLKRDIPEVKVIGVDPEGSARAPKKDGTHGYLVEGIGYDVMPEILEENVVDEWIAVGDKASFLMARRLASEEGLLCGGSSGAVLAAALEYAKKHQLDSTKRLVIILADSIRNYMTKFVSDYWMAKHGFITPPLLLREMQRVDWDTYKMTRVPTVVDGDAVYKVLCEHPIAQISNTEMFIEQSVFFQDYFTAKSPLLMLGASAWELTETFVVSTEEPLLENKLAFLFQRFHFGVIKKDAEYFYATRSFYKSFNKE